MSTVVQERERKEAEKAAAKGDAVEDEEVEGSDEDDDENTPQKPLVVRARPTLNMGSLANSTAQSVAAAKKAARGSRKGTSRKGHGQAVQSEAEDGVESNSLDPEMAKVNQHLGGGANAGCLQKLSVERALRGEKIGVAMTAVRFDAIGSYFIFFEFMILA